MRGSRPLCPMRVKILVLGVCISQTLERGGGGLSQGSSSGAWQVVELGPGYAAGCKPRERPLHPVSSSQRSYHQRRRHTCPEPHSTSVVELAFAPRLACSAHPRVQTASSVHMPRSKHPSPLCPDLLFLVAIIIIFTGIECLAYVFT